MYAFPEAQPVYWSGCGRCVLYFNIIDVISKIQKASLGSEQMTIQNQFKLKKKMSQNKGT